MQDGSLDSLPKKFSQMTNQKKIISTELNITEMRVYLLIWKFNLHRRTVIDVVTHSNLSKLSTK